VHQVDSLESYNEMYGQHNTIHKIIGIFPHIYIYVSVCVCVCVCVCGPGSSVGIATDYGLGGTGVETRWRRDFSHTSIPALGPTQPPVQ
jgi:hypothetical protein